MSDPIADMIAGYDAAGLPEGEIPVSGIHLALAHQIRQQIGRELLDPSYNGWDWEDIVSEVCQLDREEK